MISLNVKYSYKLKLSQHLFAIISFFQIAVVRLATIDWMRLFNYI